MKVYGRLEPFFETGTEGIVWSVQDPWLPSYDGLWCLRAGDHLRVLGKWEGIIDFDYERDVIESSFGGRGQAVHGFWVNGLQRDVGSEQWSEMFMHRLRAMLIPGEQQILRGAKHPFHAPLHELEQRLHEMPENEAKDLFRDSLYPWLIFYASGSSQRRWDSLAKGWGLSLSETIKLLGSPPMELVERWMQYPKRFDDMLMPFSSSQLLRLALLHRINGGLTWCFDNKDDARIWLTPERRERLMGNLDGLRSIIAELDENDCLPRDRE